MPSRRRSISGIGHHLAGAVKGHLAAAVGRHHRDAAGTQHMLGPPGHALREDRRMLAQPEFVGRVGGACLGEARIASKVGPCSTRPSMRSSGPDRSAWAGIVAAVMRHCHTALPRHGPSGRTSGGQRDVDPAQRAAEPVEGTRAQRLRVHRIADALEHIGGAQQQVQRRPDPRCARRGVPVEGGVAHLLDGQPRGGRTIALDPIRSSRSIASSSSAVARMPSAWLPVALTERCVRASSHCGMLERLVVRPGLRPSPGRAASSSRAISRWSRRWRACSSRWIQPS